MSAGRLVVVARHWLKTPQMWRRPKSLATRATFASWFGPGATRTSTKFGGCASFGSVVGGGAIWAPTPSPVGVKLPSPKKGNTLRPTIRNGTLVGAPGGVGAQQLG